MENERHPEQARGYLIDPLRRYLADAGMAAFVGGNSFVYYALDQSPLGPDVYVVNGGTHRGQHSWVAWQEDNLLPTLIIELTSPSTARIDRGHKFRLYRDAFRCPDYFLFDTDTALLEGFRLHRGAYVPVHATADGRMACSSLDLLLGVHDGWLRWFLPDGRLLPTDRERADAEREKAEAEREKAEAERQRAEAERERADRLAAKLRELGLQTD